MHAIVQDKERDAEHRERVLRAQFTVGDVYRQPLREPVYGKDGELGTVRVDVGQVVT
jgi:hypothetical protein